SSKNYNNRVNLRLEYKIDSMNSIIITPNLNFQNNRSVSQISQDIYGSNGNLLSSSSINTNSTTTGYNLSNNILFRHSFAKKGRTISIGLNTTGNKKTGDLFVMSDNRTYDSVGNLQKSSLQNQFTDNLTNSYTISS